MTEKETKQHKKFIEDLRKDAQAVEHQSRAASKDMNFIDAEGGMWHDWNDERFKNRTKLQFDRISQAIGVAVGKWNTNRVGVIFKPSDEATSDENAELENGIYRGDFRENGGKLAVDNAVDEVFKCGQACFKLGTKFEDEEDPENDNQRSEWRPIYNSYDHVFWSRQSKAIDKRDAPYVTEIEPFTIDSFEETYPGKAANSAFDTRSVWGHSRFNWRLHKDDLINVASRYEKIEKKRTVFVYNNLEENKVEVYSEEQHEKEKSRLKKNSLIIFIRKRKIIKQEVWKYVFSGQEFLEKPRRVIGRELPIIAMYGIRSFVDGVEHSRGMVRKQIDPSRLFNTIVSQTAEVASTSGQKIPIVDADSVKGLEDHYADIQNSSFLPMNPQRDNDGKIVAGSGLLGFYEPGQLDGNSAAIFQLITQFMTDTLGGVPQDTLDPNASGKAINAILKREDLGTQQYFDNIANAIEWSGVVWEGIRREIYTSGRTVNTIGFDGTESRQILGKIELDSQGDQVEINSLEGKRFKSYSDSGPQYETQREETVEIAKGILEAISRIPGAEQYSMPLLFTIFDNMPSDGMRIVKEFNRKLMLIQGIVKPETDEEKQMVAQAQQPQEDPQQKLVEAAANQQNAEARQLDASSLDKVASAEKKAAETQKILTETQGNKVGLLMDIRDRQLKQAETGFLN